jgi:hypothetical protein
LPELNDVTRISVLRHVKKTAGTHERPGGKLKLTLQLERQAQCQLDDARLRVVSISET